jgi:GxxExxY protein
MNAEDHDERRREHMKTDTDRAELDRITEKVIGCAFTVGNKLGTGFLEKVYENALAIELRKQKLLVEQQHGIKVRYEGAIVGEFAADLLVEELVLVELKAVEAVAKLHVAQCLNYLRATGLSVCLLVNFGTRRVQVKRIVRDF